MRVRLYGRWYHGDEGIDLAPGVHEVEDELGNYLLRFSFVNKVSDDTPLTPHSERMEGLTESEDPGAGLELLAELAKEVGASAPD